MGNFIITQRLRQEAK